MTLRTAALSVVFVSVCIAIPAPLAAQGAGAASTRNAPTWSLAIERVGGIAFAGVTASDADASVSAFTVGVGGPTVNPYAVPRVGVDFILRSGLTIGAAVGLASLSANFDSNGNSAELATVTLYTFTPRVGYRIALSDVVDLTPRVGMTLMGGSVAVEDDSSEASVFIFAMGADLPFAFRLTDSLNLLVGASFDVSLAGTASTDASSTDIDGTIFAVQGWLGMGGYL